MNSLSNEISQNNSFLTIYIIITLFLGNSVKAFLGLPGIDDGALFCFHYIALPFLLLAYVNTKHQKPFNFEKAIMAIYVLFFLINIIVLGKSATFAMAINILYEPIFLIVLLRTGRYPKQKLRNIILVFFLIECLVAIFEALTHQLVFIKDRDIFELGQYGVLSIRAYSLHGHPLQNAFLVSIISTVILFSGLKTYQRYALFLLGIVAVFAFNTRSSLLFLSIIFIVRLIIDFRRSRLKLILMLIAFIIPTAYYLINYLLDFGLGDRFFISMDDSDGSSVARFMLIDIFMNLDIETLLLGMSPENVILLLKTLGLVAIENSLFNVLFSWGIVFAAIYFFGLYRMFWTLKVDNLMFYTLILVFTLLLNVNNAIQSDTPIIPIAFLALYAFQTDKKGLTYAKS